MSDFVNINEMEISSVIAWMLDPKGLHDLGNQALKGLLAQIRKQGHSAPNLAAMKNVHIFTESHCKSSKNEDGRVDILLISKKASTVILIENKFGAERDNEQLKKYYLYAEEKFAELDNKIYIIMDFYRAASIESGTKQDDPEYEEIKKHWIELDYQWLLDLINANKRKHIFKELSNYFDQLSYIIPNGEMDEYTKRLKKIYDKYKDDENYKELTAYSKNTIMPESLINQNDEQTYFCLWHKDILEDLRNFSGMYKIAHKLKNKGFAYELKRSRKYFSFTTMNVDKRSNGKWLIYISLYFDKGKLELTLMELDKQSNEHKKIDRLLVNIENDNINKIVDEADNFYKKHKNKFSLQ